MNSRYSQIDQIHFPYICPFPWTSLAVNYDGGISFCCFHYPIAHISQVKNNAFDEIWNGEAAQELRQRWKDDKLQGTPCEYCHGLEMNKRFGYPVNDMATLPSGTYADNVHLNISELQEGKTILQSMPVDILYVPSVLCNIDCIHCCQPAIGKNNNTFINTEDLLAFFKSLGRLSVSNAFSGGEPLYLRQTYKLLEQFTTEHKAASELILFTNAQLIKNSFDKIKGFRKYSFEISIVSFRREIYEHIHRNSSYDILIENLNFLNSKKAKGMDISLTQIMVLMKSNFTDLESAFDFAQRYGFEELWVFALHAAYEKFRLIPEENFFDLPYLLEKIPGWKEILSKAKEKASATGHIVAYNHLVCISKQISTSTAKNRLLSVRNSLDWFIRSSILRLFARPRQRKWLRQLWWRWQSLMQ